MHLLIIDEGPQRITTSQHGDIADAKRAVADYAAHTDCWLHPIQLHAAFSSWDLVKVYDGSSLATATVERVRTTPSDNGRLAADTQDRHARAALRTNRATFTGAHSDLHRAS
jgi:hypothetical protein